LTASVALSPTPNETFQVQEGGHHIEKTATEEVAAARPEAVGTQVILTTQPPTENAALAEQFKSSAPEAETGDEVAMYVAEPTSETDWGNAIPENQAQPQSSEDKTSDILLGVELFLMLLVLGTGIAWIYLRRRGG
jgi:hypothetical protein